MSNQGVDTDLTEPRLILASLFLPFTLSSGQPLVANQSAVPWAVLHQQPPNSLLQSTQNSPIHTNSSHPNSEIASPLLQVHNYQQEMISGNPYFHQQPGLSPPVRHGSPTAGSSVGSTSSGFPLDSPVGGLLSGVAPGHSNIIHANRTVRHTDSITATAPPARYNFRYETNPERLPPVKTNLMPEASSLSSPLLEAERRRDFPTVLTQAPRPRHRVPPTHKSNLSSPPSSPHTITKQPRERRHSVRSTVARPNSWMDGELDNHESNWHLETSLMGNIGLQKAIESVKSQIGQHVWVGTLGIKTDCFNDSQKRLIAEKLVKEDCVPCFPGDQEAIGHYNQFCKEVLWPTMHYILPEYPKKNFNENEAWNHYVTVNRHFANTIVATYRPGDMSKTPFGNSVNTTQDLIVWVHDYHLLLVPSMVRKELPHASIGFFLHIPFPSSEVFRCLPERKQLLEGLLGADIIGFQTYPFARHFLQTVSRILGYEITPKGVLLENNVVVVGIFPIGIDTEALNAKRRLPEVQEMVKILREKYWAKKVIVARDKLDPVKGVRQKLLAFELFLNKYTDWQGKVVLVQVALSTTDHPELQRQVSDIIRRINSKFGKIDYTPVVYLYQDISFSHYLALLTMADACLITSIRDGMNLTSHEYIVCQEQSHNPLIISEFTGTYGSFGAAIRINPFHYKEVAAAINEALTMSYEQRSRTHGELFKHVTSNTAAFWATSFVTEMKKISTNMQRRFSLHIPHLSVTPLMPIYTQSIQRVFILNYDGVLVPYEKSPSAVSPSTSLEKVLSRLSEDSRNKIYIMSGRTKSGLLERVPDVKSIGLCAEHGCFIRHPDSSSWSELISDVDLSWRSKVMEIFEYYTERTPGSLIEKKDLSIVWHYRMADVEFGEWQAKECQNHIADGLEKIYPIHAVMGKKNVEVRPKAASKCNAVKYILSKFEDVSFVCYIGDERSDEEVFEYLNSAQTFNPSRCYLTCTVGSKKSKANYFVTGVSEVLQVLGLLAN